jgi:hypothetical protein
VVHPCELARMVITWARNPTPISANPVLAHRVGPRELLWPGLVRLAGSGRCELVVVPMRGGSGQPLPSRRQTDTRHVRSQNGRRHGSFKQSTAYTCYPNLDSRFGPVTVDSISGSGIQARLSLQLPLTGDLVQKSFVFCIKNWPLQTNLSST